MQPCAARPPQKISWLQPGGSGSKPGSNIVTMSSVTASAQPAPSAGTASARANRWPSQVRFILGNEAAERFSYYGMKGILALYITNVLLQTRDYATEVIHYFGFVNYFMPIMMQVFTMLVMGVVIAWVASNIINLFTEVGKR